MSAIGSVGEKDAEYYVGLILLARNEMVRQREGFKKIIVIKFILNGKFI